MPSKRLTCHVLACSLACCVLSHFRTCSVAKSLDCLLTALLMLNAYGPATNFSSIPLLYRPNNLLMSKTEEGWKIHLTLLQIVLNKIPSIKTPSTNSSPLWSEENISSLNESHRIYWGIIIIVLEGLNYFLCSMRCENGWTTNISTYKADGRDVDILTCSNMSCSQFGPALL